jgi:hypothetical protein
VHPVGLYDLDRKIRPVGEAYREIIREWREFLPAQSLALSLPAFPPSRQEDPLVRDIAEHARRLARPAAGEPSVPPADVPSGTLVADAPVLCEPDTAGEALA